MTPEQAIAVLESEEGFIRLTHSDDNANEHMAAIAVLKKELRDAQKWRANKDAVYCAHAMLQAARPTILNMLNCERAVKEYEK